MEGAWLSIDRAIFRDVLIGRDVAFYGRGVAFYERGVVFYGRGVAFH